jgi:dTDP-4-amino-4,6-dideoxygalactose transaminase
MVGISNLEIRNWKLVMDSKEFEIHTKGDAPQEMIPLVDLVAQYRSIQPEIDAAIQKVLITGRFILGDEVSALEGEIAAYLGVKHGVGVASGTDALILALRALGIGPGDEVILPAYTFFATAGAVLNVGAAPKLVDIDPKTYCLDTEQVRASISPATKAIIPVHLYGHPADMNPILELAQEQDLKIIEDNAQAFGSSYFGRKTGSFGDLACLSFFPSKNLGGYGDGGMVVTDDEELAKVVSMLRTHGWQQKYFPEILGYNSRLDTLQAAILRVKLGYIDRWNERRRELAEAYNQSLSRIPDLTLPYQAPGVKHVYHLYVVSYKGRDALQQNLKENGISSSVYYPQPLHLSDPCKGLGYQQGDFPHSERASRETLAIPLYPEMTQEQVNRVVSAIGMMFT